MSEKDRFFDPDEQVGPLTEIGESSIPSTDLLAAIDGLRALLSDLSTVTRACGMYAEQTGSTSAIVALLKCRDYVETIAANAPALPPQRSGGRQEQIVGNYGGEHK